MASSSENNDQNNDAAAYSSMKEEITAISNQLLSAVTLTPPYSLHTPSLPVDLVIEILCRLPVKLLLQLRCVCKSWNHLISHPKFAKKHLSTTRSRLCLVTHTNVPGKLVIASYPLDSVFTGITTNITNFVEYQEKYPLNKFDHIVGSYDGIVCLVDNDQKAVLLWNPSIRKFKQSPPWKMPRMVSYSNVGSYDAVRLTYGFGYDHVSDAYKVVVAISYTAYYKRTSVDKTELKVYTPGTNVWKTVREEFPVGVDLPTIHSVHHQGKFVSGKINWLASKDWSKENTYSIVSFDLGNESYQQLLLPYLGDLSDSWILIPSDSGELCVPCMLILGVLRDCLCLIVGHHDVWIMKEYGNNESWTKLFTVPYSGDPNNDYNLTKVVYIFEDDQVLFQSYGEWNPWLTVYYSKNGAFKSTKIAKIAEVCVESLISPCPNVLGCRSGAMFLEHEIQL